MGGGYSASADTRCGSLEATSVNSLLNLVILRQISEARMPHLTNNQTHGLNHLPRITCLNGKWKIQKSVHASNLHTLAKSQRLVMAFYYVSLLTFKQLSSLSLFLS